MASRNAMARTWDVHRREVVLRHVLNDGTAWELDSAATLERFVAAVGKVQSTTAKMRFDTQAT